MEHTSHDDAAAHRIDAKVLVFVAELIGGGFFFALAVCTWFHHDWQVYFNAGMFAACVIGAMGDYRSLMIVRRPPRQES